MNKQDLEDIIKFAEERNLMQEPFDEVYEMWLESKQG